MSGRIIKETILASMENIWLYEACIVQ